MLTFTPPPGSEVRRPRGSPVWAYLVARVPGLRSAPLGDDRCASARREADPEVVETGGFARCGEKLWRGWFSRATSAQVKPVWVSSDERRDERYVL